MFSFEEEMFMSSKEKELNEREIIEMGRYKEDNRLFPKKKGYEFNVFGYKCLVRRRGSCWSGYVSYPINTQYDITELDIKVHGPVVNRGTYLRFDTTQRDDFDPSSPIRTLHSTYKDWRYTADKCRELVIYLNNRVNTQIRAPCHGNAERRNRSSSDPIKIPSGC